MRLTLQQVMATSPHYLKPLDPPPYVGPPMDHRVRLGLAPIVNINHMTDEAYQLFLSLEKNGYDVVWSGLYPNISPDVGRLLEGFQPGIVITQDKREWMGYTGHRTQDQAIRFQAMNELKNRDDIFKITIVKDAQNDTMLHLDAANEIGCHAWICYYHPDTVANLCPIVRRRHLIRTYHTLNSDLVPDYRVTNRIGCILSGALGPAYPLRTMLARAVEYLPETVWLRHPGYATPQCYTPGYLQTLSQFKVSICTASRYGYALRKIIESVACGCTVITDLPARDRLPEIDNALVRISPNATVEAVADIVRHSIDHYEPAKAQFYADAAKRFYDYRHMGWSLVQKIEVMRSRYWIYVNAKDEPKP